VPRRSWSDKLADSLRGIRTGIRGESNFAVHLVMAAAVILVAALLQVTREEWCLLVMCIAAVLAAEYFNTSLERLARVVDRNHNPNIGAALDMASAAVLIAAIGAAIVGCVVFGHRAGALLGWWD
jgi:diacylglycerol kinase